MIFTNKQCFIYRSACFSHKFDNPAVHIPKQYNGDVLEYMVVFVVLNVCSYLKNEQLDDSTKWENMLY